MKIALIGFKGTLGSAVLKYWNKIRVDSSVEQPESLESPDEIVPFDLPEFDVSSRRFVLDAMTTLRPDVILNASGINLIDWLESRPNTARTVNIYGPANLRQAAERIDALLVQIGCGEVFYSSKTEGTNGSTQAKSETDVANPESVFAKSKLDGERAASEWERSLIVRTSPLFGPPGQVSSGNLVETLLRSFARTRQIQAIDDLFFSPTYSLDVVLGLKSLIRNGATGLYHFCDQGIASPFEVATFLKNYCGLKRCELVPISADEYGFQAARSRRVVLDCSKYRRLPGVYLPPSWQESLRKYMDGRSPF